MNKFCVFLILSFFSSENLFSQTIINQDSDTTKIFKTDEIQVLSNRETNSLSNIPAPISTISKQEINSQQIQNIRNLSILIPNLFVPDYGSKMSNAIYIRGIGSRGSDQTVGLYVDNIPFLERATFNFDFFDIQQIEILRGTQATLYGRNSMSGIMNIYTISPFAHQGLKAEIGTGNYGTFNTKISSYHLLRDNLGFSVGAYFARGNGFFKNEFLNKNADDWKNIGGRIKFDALLKPNILAQTIVNFETANQTAFPYKFYNDSIKTYKPIEMNNLSEYKQNSFTASQMFDFDFGKFTIISTTAFQNFSDEMNMDQDFTSDSIFTLKQIQKRNSIIEEIIFKSKINNSETSNFFENYNWNFGLFGFYNSLNTTAGVLFQNNGVKNLIENNVNANLPPFAKYSIINENLPINNDFQNPSFGAAIYHQSTANNLFVQGLSFTAGIRFDYETNKLNYNTNSELLQSYQIQFGQNQIQDTMPASVLFDASIKKDFFQILPKFALNYTISENARIYGSIARGYKSGGFNIQMLSDLAQNDLKADMISQMKTSIFEKLVASGTPPEVINNLILSRIPDVNRVENLGEKLWYEPEYCWDFEVGSYLSFWDNKLNAAISLYYMNLKDIQLTQFSPNGFGRMLSNAGTVTSKGFEISLNAKISDNFILLLDYGFANATFTNYKDTIFSIVEDKNIEVDYSGKRVPYAPQQTFSAAIQFNKKLVNFVVDAIFVNFQYSGVGTIYWNEANDLSQNFYNLLNGKIGLEKGKFGLELWAKNITNTEHQVFFFETLGNKFFQIGQPFHFGATLKINFDYK